MNPFAFPVHKVLIKLLIEVGNWQIFLSLLSVIMPKLDELQYVKIIYL